MTNPKQQEINRKVVQRFVYGCVSMEVEAMLRHGWELDDLPSWDDVSNYPAKRDWDEIRDENPSEWEDFLLNEVEDVLKDHFINSWHRYLEADDDNDLDGFLDWLEEDRDETGSKPRETYLAEIELDDDQQEAWLEYAENHNIEIDDDASEIFEWWMVDNWFAEKIEEMGESILHLSLTSVWGRRTTGQAILLDGIITKFQQKWAPWAAEGVEDDTTED